MVAQPSDSATIAPDLLQTIQTKVRSLPPERQQEVLDFVEFLAQKTQSPPPQKTIPEESQKTIWEKIRERTARIPPEEWDEMPTDGSYQHDHYLYGTPKREL
jgi:Protein of unknown function (DUF2281)